MPVDNLREAPGVLNVLLSLTGLFALSCGYFYFINTRPPPPELTYSVTSSCPVDVTYSITGTRSEQVYNAPSGWTKHLNGLQQAPALGATLKCKNGRVTATVTPRKGIVHSFIATGDYAVALVQIRDW
ncbi:hypothetical protein MF271_23205 (plasmid) [Deinococcus sp. KNUC1210]|uniref:hypothetical protein n=1 Tax=Deinococcus sp. KNUC1210 TaxID=2917691 RepID=UPI001EF1476E|nr:hypothetical protein [Deinococcus sp. KNUC1210]ULH17886.1 hypothetical protein MF271_23205 [Deinococcus sp. KNUC1210]